MTIGSTSTTSNEGTNHASTQAHARRRGGHSAVTQSNSQTSGDARQQPRHRLRHSDGYRCTTGRFQSPAGIHKSTHGNPGSGWSMTPVRSDATRQELVARIVELEAEVWELKRQSIHNQTQWLSPLDRAARVGGVPDGHVFD